MSRVEIRERLRLGTEGNLRGGDPVPVAAGTLKREANCQRGGVREGLIN